MTTQNRGQFSSRLGFVLAAAGAAVGLGNIWGFPTQAAQHGGGAFLLVYLILVFALAYPVLVAELLIGRHGQANSVRSLMALGQKKLAVFTGLAGIFTVCLILSFYAIVAGWLLSYLLGAGLRLGGLDAAAKWSEHFGFVRNTLFTLVFMAMTAFVVSRGVSQGLENWSKRLMPMLFALLLALIGFMLTREGAAEGLARYLTPDLSALGDPALLLSATGQAFFSLGLGVGAMMVYGSYLKADSNLPKLALSVTLVDTSVAFLAGLLILPAMYAAQNLGVQIHGSDGNLVSSSTLVFDLLPALFAKLGALGPWVALAFFLLMGIAAITSSINILELPVSFVAEETRLSRAQATWLIGAGVSLLALAILWQFDRLFGLVISVSTQYLQPFVGLLLCVFTGWVWHRHRCLEALAEGSSTLATSGALRFWRWYVKWVCPLLIAALLAQSFR
ncbi:MAG: sodium-dependent transporter [Pseudomonadota bacterium]|uniref:sodium-dependent transporter n=1 Tax=Gallaecimonas pentaromativorans TaxID=584787 RepID=UPI00067F1390|nr:sodium-dependent transporter [Gallaecimonas pentaromativorans]MED5525582.1 sodium-dependent transporter [Pseudomonadota bacterium]